MIEFSTLINTNFSLFPNHFAILGNLNPDYDQKMTKKDEKFDGSIYK